MAGKVQKQRIIFSIYWFMLAYAIAALVFWYIALNRQNNQVAFIRQQMIAKDDPNRAAELKKVESFRQRKSHQYMGEGITFMVVLTGAAIFIHRAVRRQFIQSRQQQSFMMAVTHELKTPLAITRLNLETLTRHKLDPEKQQKLYQTSLEEINRLHSLTNNLLLSSQYEQSGFRFSPEKMDCSEFLTELVESYRNRYPARNFIANVPDQVMYNGDRILLSLAINNLLDNAVKYSKNDVVISLANTGSHVQISVADEGAGISDAEKKHVFKKFYRPGNEATRSAKGTGLGLYLAQRIVLAHRGFISIEDNKPKGTVFIINLPHIHHDR